jgi:hypothetical protein
MPRVIGDAKFQADDGGDPTAGPELSAKAIGGRTSVQQRGQAGKVLGRQPPRGPGRRPAPKSLGADFAGPCHPLTDGPLADTQGFGNLALRPAPLLEVPGLDAPSFFPVVRCLVHAWQSTTGSIKL